MPDLVLASQSPRRAALLEQLGVSFTVQPAHIDESLRRGEVPRHYVERMAQEKAAAIAGARTLPVLGADTTVVLDGESLGKPGDGDAARAMLGRLSGRRHQVLSAVCVCSDGVQHTLSVATAVEFCELSPELIAAYIASGEPWDKAGGYAIQGIGGALVRAIEGSYSSVVGLPLAETRELLQRIGVRTALSGETA
jgi:septum formation protein